MKPASVAYICYFCAHVPTLFSFSKLTDYLLYIMTWMLILVTRRVQMFPLHVKQNRWSRQTTLITVLFCFRH
jgi:hypothetical protein